MYICIEHYIKMKRIVFTFNVAGIETYSITVNSVFVMMESISVGLPNRHSALKSSIMMGFPLSGLPINIQL